MVPIAKQIVSLLQTASDPAFRLLTEGAAVRNLVEERSNGILERLQNREESSVSGKNCVENNRLIFRLLTDGEKFDIGPGSLDRPIFPHFGGK
jgi:hypothetical protein